MENALQNLPLIKLVVPLVLFLLGMYVAKPPPDGGGRVAGCGRGDAVVSIMVAFAAMMVSIGAGMIVINSRGWSIAGPADVAIWFATFTFSVFLIWLIGTMLLVCRIRRMARVYGIISPSILVQFAIITGALFAAFGAFVYYALAIR